MENSASSRYKDKIESTYEVIWSNQFEPSTKTQHASQVYETRWHESPHCNQDIATVDVVDIPKHDLLVGGFPCQDYSVATTLKNAKGLIGKKGVLWWSIHKILSEKQNKPKYLFLENVDRLLISPSGQRGRDFAIILQILNELGYAVEWRVINAADYGMPQRRRRIFILGYLKGTSTYNDIKTMNPLDYCKGFSRIKSQSFLPKEFQLVGDIVSISENFNKNETTGVFENSGLMVNGNVRTLKTMPQYEGKHTLLGDLIVSNDLANGFNIDNQDIEKWIYLKGPKKEKRKNAEGFEYNYSEGGMIFPDPLDKPSRTIITGEGGGSPSRFKHVIKTVKGYRRLSPIELERLNMFPDEHTNLQGLSDTKRAFFMGNALVVGVIEKIGISLKQKISFDIEKTQNT